MPIPILIPLGIAALAAFALMSKGGEDFPHLNPQLNANLKWQLHENRNPAQLRALAVTLRQTGNLTRAANAQASADYFRAADALEARAHELERTGAGTPSIPGAPPPPPGLDPVSQVAQVLAQAGPDVAATVPTVLSQAQAPGAPGPLPPPVVLPSGQVFQPVPGAQNMPNPMGPAATPPFVPPPPPVVAPPIFAPPIPIPIPGVTAPAIPGLPGGFPGFPAAVPPFVPAAPIGPPKYVVAPGDFAGIIAQRFGLTLHQLAVANPQHTRSWDQIQVGERFNLPPGAQDRGPRLHATGLAAAA